VKAFFENLKKLLSRPNLICNEIYNLDETGNSASDVLPKIICAKWIKQEGSVASGERGLNVTVACCKCHW
jgi:hypothetical protein